MRIKKKKELIAIVELLNSMNKVIIANLRSYHYNSVVSALEESSLTVETLIKELKNYNQIKDKINKYQQILTAVYVLIVQNKKINVDMVEEQLNMTLLEMANLLESAPIEKTIIVFLPYKASMWDSMSSIYQAAKKEQQIQLYVVPIPYYDKNSDGSKGNLNYEGDLFPDDVEITSYMDIKLSELNPDFIYFHNPYDDANAVTDIVSDFYSEEIKDYCDELVYVPYFVLEEENLTVESVRAFAYTPGVKNATKVIVQSEIMKDLYIEALVQRFGSETEEYWQRKILALGSPKYDRHISSVSELNEWQAILDDLNYHSKKIVLYNTTIGAFLANPEAMLFKIECVIQKFKQLKDRYILLWRPHPLMASTIQAMHPELFGRYVRIVEQYKAEKIGIFDDTPNLNRSLQLADYYYGDHSSLVKLCELRNIPILIQNPFII